MTYYDQRLREIASRVPVERIGIYSETKDGELSVTWRDSFTGESGMLFVGYSKDLFRGVALVLCCMRELHQWNATANWSDALRRELDKRVQVGREQRKAVAA